MLSASLSEMSGCMYDTLLGIINKRVSDVLDAW